MTARPRVRSAVVLAAIALALPGAAGAQARNDVQVSVGVGAVYDDNILWRPEPQSDHVWRLSPALTIHRDTARTQWLTDGAFDAEWFSRNRDLSTPAARQHLGTRLQWQGSPRAMLVVAGGYENSVNPTELNVATGLNLGRVRAWRWFGGPEVGVNVASRTKLTTSYQAIADYAETTSDIVTHRGEALVTQTLGERDELRIRYIPEWFQFEAAGHTLSHRALVGWSRRLTPATRLTVDGGVRIAEATARPDVDFSLLRTEGFFDASVSYAWTQSSALGLTRLIDVQRALGTLRYSRPGRTGAALQGGVYLNDLGTSRADVYSASAEVTQPLFGVVAIAASYGVDYQRGRVNVGLSPGVGLLTPFPPAAPGAPTEQRVHRSVFQIRLVFAAERRTPRPVEPVPDPTRDPRTRIGGRDDR